MLDHLELLDDATPPAPDAALLAGVHRRAARRRLRNRVSAAGAGIVVLAVVVGAVGLLRDDAKKVDVVGPAKEQPAASEGRLADGVHLRMTVDAARVVLGEDVAVHIDVRNDTDKTQNIGTGPSVQCALGVQPSLRNAEGSFSTTDGSELSCLQTRGMAAGATAAFSVSVSTAWLSLPEGQRDARYDLVLLRIPSGPRRFGATTVSAPPIAIDVVAPDLTARLDVASSTVAAGQVIHGTITFNNASDATINAGCLHSLSYRVSLAAGDVVLNPNYFSAIGPSSGSCRKKLRLLPPGPSRFPFNVRAQFFGCSPDISRGPIPRCIGHLQTPLLPPGRYEVVFEGRGPLGSIQVAPVPIRVVTAR